MLLRMKKFMKRGIQTLGLMMLAAAVVTLTGCKHSKYDYETVEDDVLQTKMYTLDNGLKVFMTVNPEKPTIQTYIAVHAGSKHEPIETTGLAHYLEHMMFKGSSNFGTTDYQAEKPYLDKIRDLYETYRKSTDPAERKAIYHEIDSISYEASSYFIPNEYDKLMSHLGSQGSNAFTSYDQTVYQEDIPSNQIENWAKVQSDRFKNMVLRGFHTELEAVYEEFNKGLNSDWDHLSTALFGTLTPGHPYSHSVIGFGDHLKNPSIVNIENFFHTYYVPNNVAICLSGDFDPDEMIDMLNKYFGDWQKNEELVQPAYEPIPALTQVVEKEVVTPNPEMLVMGWRFDGAKSHQTDTLEVLSQVLSNNNAGLFDLDINLAQKALAAQTEMLTLCDYSVLLSVAMPLPGQSLEELRTLISTEVEKLKKGEFSDDLVQSIITQMKLDEQRKLEDNDSRAMAYVDAFINDVPWAEAAQKQARIAQLTKQDIVDFACRHFSDNYVAIYKRQGVDPTIKPVEKPAITPIQMNRDTVSQFAREIMQGEVKPIEPRFVDFKKDLSMLSTGNDQQLYYRQNSLNDLFSLTYLYEMGTAGDRYLPLAAQYLDYLGTDSMTAEQIQQQFFLLGCRFNVRSDMRRTQITLSGLQENMPKAVALLEDLLAHCKVDSAVYQTLVQSELQQRQNILASFDYYRGFLRTYLQYGTAGTELELTNEEVMNAKPEELVERIHKLLGYQHRILYYGPARESEVIDLMDQEHNNGGEALTAVPENPVIPMLLPTENSCYVLPYGGTQSFVMVQYAANDNKYDADAQGALNLYNEYFGGGMNTIVFQEMREKRSLCYGAGAMYINPSWQDEHEWYYTQIQSQNDKLADCITVFEDIVNNMPASEAAFNISKQGLLTQMRTSRTSREGYLWAYINAQDLGLEVDPAEATFHQVEALTLDDLVKFQQSHVKGLKYRSGFAGDPAGLDPQQLERLGEVKVLTPHEVFGF